MPKNTNFSKSGAKIIFLGTPQFAVPILEKLASSNYKPAAVFCAPGKPVGRRQILTPPPVKIAAQKHNIPVFQPKDKKELVDQLKNLGGQLIISAAFGLILPKEILDAPAYGCLNIHPSLLPRYRGASPVQAAILNGDSETGVTIFKMDAGVDTGPIIKSSKFKIQNSKLAAPEMTKELSELGADLLLEILPDWLAGKITPKPQDDSQASYSPQIKKEDGQIDWRKSAQDIERQIRAFTPWPGSDAGINNIKILEAEIENTDTSRPVGEVFLTGDKKLAVQTGAGYLVVLKLQVAGGKPMIAVDFLRGHRQIIGQILS